MDFFAAQAAAKRRTSVLVLWFALAFAGTVAAIWAGLGLLFQVSGRAYGDLAFTPELAAWVAGGVALVTLTGSSVHRARLSAGGSAVATMLGGVPVDRRSEDPGERRLVNVVEEMAIAAGLPVPALYVLPGEAGINAFAAGFSPDRAVVAVTRGALERLSRDELQGVVAHELSHVLNGDARLNLELLSVIGGITALAALGRFLVQLTGDSSRSRSSWRSRRSGGGGILAAGLVIWAAGAVGAFFGRLIRAAVSRQREFLADAAAVQFTRNPDGLAGALARIAQAGSKVESAFAPEAAHLFFADGLSSRWFASHPPLEARIKKLVPQGFLRVMRKAAEPFAAPGPEEAPPVAALAGRAASSALGATPAAPLTAAAIVASVGNPAPRHVAHAARVLRALPAEVQPAAREPAAASALVRALLADGDPAARAAQLGALPDAALRAEVERLARILASVAPEDRMAVLDLALPALDGLAPDAAAALVRDLAAVAAADGRTTVFEWAVLRIVRRRLARKLGLGARPARLCVLDEVQEDVLDVLSTLAWGGTRDGLAAQAALDAALPVLGIRARWKVLPRDRVAAKRLEAALDRLDGAVPRLKAQLVGACAAAVLVDGCVVPAEGELLRAIAASLGVPVPPLEAEVEESAERFG